MGNCTAKMLLLWYDRHRRSLPWRDVGDPYRTWISEIMLQQTRVETVIPYYERFLAAFPDVQSLAAAELDDVLKLWEGLGYYSRARNLHRGARQVVEEHGGMIPHEVVQLRKITGIGAYTAGAIASIAYGVRTPAVDGNVIRVVSRLRGIRENIGIPSVRRMLEAEADALVPQERPGDFNQAMMDLGSAVCVPGTPECSCCPLCTVCDAYNEGDADELPVLPLKTPPKVQEYSVLLLTSEGRMLMRQRTELLLRGLWVYPMLEGWRDDDELAAEIGRTWRLNPPKLRYLGEAKHVFTHRVWQMRIYAAELPAGTAAPHGMRFVALAEMKGLTIPTAIAAARKRADDILSASM